MDTRLILDPPGRGSWNMAVDEALFQSSQRTRQQTFRFYEWSEPTLSLGYFQAASQRRLHPPSSECSLVRRSTGGGAILHHRELTYSLVLPWTSDRVSESLRFVDAVHGALIEALAEVGVFAHRQGTRIERSREAEPFLCFQRRAAEDVVMGDYKIAGSAQRKSQGTLLQHGSVLLHRSEAAPELPGIGDLAAVNGSTENLLSAWLAALGRHLGYSWIPSQRDTEENNLAEQIEQEKFATSRWNQKR